MVIFSITLFTMLFAVAAMSVGVVLSGRRLKGSCGGLASGSCACRDQGVQAGAGCPRKHEEPDTVHQIGALRSSEPSERLPG